MQEDENHQQDENAGFDQRTVHAFDACLDKLGRIEGNGVIQTGRKILLEAFDGLANILRHFQSIRAG